MRQPSADAVTERLKQTWPGISQYVGKELTIDDLSVFASLAYSASMPKSRKSQGKVPGKPLQDAMFGSVRHMLGMTATKRLLVSNMTRLLANWNYIADGMEIPRWRGERITADVVFLAVERMPPEPGKSPRLRVRTKLKTGLGAGIICWFALTDSLIYRFLDKYSGCGRMECSAEELSGMQARLTISIDAGRPSVDAWSTTEEQRKENRRLTTARSELTKCNARIPCNVCRKTVSQCPLAVWADKKEENGGREEDSDMDKSKSQGRA